MRPLPIYDAVRSNGRLYLMKYRIHSAMTFLILLRFQLIKQIYPLKICIALKRRMLAG